MSKIKGANTSPEILLRKYLSAKAIRYQINTAKYLGKPDIVIKKHKLAIFVDGEFWHGYKWQEKKRKIKSNRHYWIPKIEGNIKRDKTVNRELKKQGWKVIRVWEHKVRREHNAVLTKICRHLNHKKNDPSFKK